MELLPYMDKIPKNVLGPARKIAKRVALAAALESLRPNGEDIMLLVYTAGLYHGMNLAPQLQEGQDENRNDQG